jgi:hypothetical protein
VNSWQGFRTANESGARTARRQLMAARSLGAAAVVIVIIGSAVVLFADKETPAMGPSTVVAVVDGVAVCGELSKDDVGLEVDGVPMTGQVASVTVVNKCP